jgi:hypothetical protein
MKVQEIKHHLWHRNTGAIPTKHPVGRFEKYNITCGIGGQESLPTSITDEGLRNTTAPEDLEDRESLLTSITEEGSRNTTSPEELELEQSLELKQSLPTGIADKG